MDTYSFNMSPKNYQPSGCADFSKIYTPKHKTLTYTDLNTKEQEVYNIPRTEITDENGIKKFKYIFPPPFVKKHNLAF
jgi:hypothetical protein